MNIHEIAKRVGVSAIAKAIVDEGRSYGISEHELTELIQQEAELTRKSGETPAQCFARFYSAPENVGLRKAIAIAKGAPPLLEIEPMPVANDGDQDEAMAELETLAEAERRRDPRLSKAQAFAKAFTHPANAELAARAHRRPQPTACR